MSSRLFVRVSKRTIEADDVVVLELTAVDQGLLPEFTPGAHIGLYLPSGLVRQYSICNDPVERHRYVIAVLRAPDSRGGSIAVHAELHEGSLVQISPPRNDFPLADAQRYLLFAGGIGITPILCMARHLQQSGISFSAHYCSRSPSKMAFRKELLNSPLGKHFSLHFDDSPATQMDLAAVLNQAKATSHIYVCGPEGYINYVVSSAKARGWRDEHIHWERFSAPPPSAGARPFKIQLATSGTVLDVPADMTALQVLLGHGCDVPSSCEQGTCGTCVVGLIEGEPDHRDSYLTDDEQQANTYFVPCCSRAKSPVLVLDL